MKIRQRRVIPVGSYSVVDGHVSPIRTGDALVVRQGDTLVVRVKGGRSWSENRDVREGLMERLPGLADVVVIDADGLAVYRSQTAAELWEGETCDDCGGRYERTIWWAADELWLRLVGHGGGLLCPGCFDDRAKELGLSLIWEPRVERAVRPK